MQDGGEEANPRSAAGRTSGAAAQLRFCVRVRLSPKPRRCATPQSRSSTAPARSVRRPCPSTDPRGGALARCGDPQRNGDEATFCGGLAWSRPSREALSSLSETTSCRRRAYRRTRTRFPAGLSRLRPAFPKALASRREPERPRLRACARSRRIAEAGCVTGVVWAPPPGLVQEPVVAIRVVGRPLFIVCGCVAADTVAAGDRVWVRW
jgi:hypothetical protein